MNDTIIKTVAEAERDRLIGIIVGLERSLGSAELLLRRCHGALQQTGDDDWIVSTLAIDLRQYLQNKSCTILAPMRKFTCEPKAETGTPTNGQSPIEPAPSP